MRENVRMRPVVFATSHDLAFCIALEIRDALAAASRTWLLGFPTGRSCVGVLTELTAMTGVRWSRLGVVLLDAYCMDDSRSLLPRHHPAHPLMFMDNHLVEPVFSRWGYQFKDEQFWVPGTDDVLKADEALEASGVDLMLLASGSGDGHVAFNGPGTPPESRTRFVSLPESTRLDNLSTYPFFGTLESVPSAAVTVGIATIRNVSRRTIMVVSGPDKDKSLAQLVAADKYTAQWPASVVADCDNARLFTDEPTFRRYQLG